MTKKVMFFTVLVFFLGTSYALAVESPGLGSNENSQSAQTQANLSTGTADSDKKCEQVKARITQRIRNFDDNRNRHLESYQKINDRLDELVTSLEAKGYDTYAVKEKLTAFNQLMNEYRNNYVVYQQNLTNAGGVACDSEQANFSGALKQARNQLKTVRQNHTALHTFWAKELRPAVLALKEQTPVTTEETENTTINEEIEEGVNE